MENHNRARVLAAVGGIVAGLAGCGGTAAEGAVGPADPATSGAEKNHCQTGEPHHCAYKDGKHVCGTTPHAHGPGDGHEDALPGPGAAPAPAAVDAGAPTSAPTDGGAGPAAADGAHVDGGAAPKSPGHTHSDGKPHKH